MLPFQRGSVATAYALNVLEHLDDLPGAMCDLWGILQPAGRVLVEVPYFAGVSAFADPTHRRFFTYTTFDHFGPPATRGWQANRHTWFGEASFQTVRRRLVFGRAHRLLGIAWLANRFPGVYENLFAYWFPARALEVTLLKTSPRSVRQDRRLGGDDGLSEVAEVGEGGNDGIAALAPIWE